MLSSQTVDIQMKTFSINVFESSFAAQTPKHSILQNANSAAYSFCFFHLRQLTHIKNLLNG